MRTFPARRNAAKGKAFLCRETDTALVGGCVSKDDGFRCHSTHPTGSTYPTGSTHPTGWPAVGRNLARGRTTCIPLAGSPAAHGELNDIRAVQSRRPSKEALRLRISGFHRFGFYESGGRTPLFVVEADHPAFSGMLHIFNGDQLESR